MFLSKVIPLNWGWAEIFKGGGGVRAFLLVEVISFQYKPLYDVRHGTHCNDYNCSKLHSRNLNSISAEVQILLLACRRFAMDRISDNGPGWK